MGALETAWQQGTGQALPATVRDWIASQDQTSPKQES
jgi:hypothetical protein